MKNLLILIFAFFLSACVQPKSKKTFGQKIDEKDLILNIAQAERLASLPMKCIAQEFPNKLGQVLGDSAQLLRPKILHPAFYGCFDWHSSVHGHWLLVRLLKEFPEMDQKVIRAKLTYQLSKSNILNEVRFFKTKHNQSFERTYGWAWVLKLHGELLSFQDSFGRELATSLQPLAEHIVQEYLKFLPKLTHPLRSGEHANTAFGLSLAYDYAILTKNEKFKNLIKDRALHYYFLDKKAPIAYEPSGFDFLSPIFEEINLMDKILPHNEFKTWLAGFLPSLLNTDFALIPAIVSDRTDGKLVHLDGLNFSRAWCMYSLAKNNTWLNHLKPIADVHLKSSLPSIVDGDYMGEHWLASFALYALLERKKN